MSSPGGLRTGLLLIVLCLCIAPGLGTASEPAPELEVFVRAGCPHCEAAKRFLQELQRARPELRILFHDLDLDRDAAARLDSLAQAQGLPVVGVPAFSVNGQLIVGYQDDRTTGARVLAMLDRLANRPPVEPFTACRPVQPDCTTTSALTTEPDSIVLPWIGPVTARELGLPLFTLAIGLLDGFNPCAMWVLLFLLSLLVTLHDRFAMALISGTFVLMSGLIYFAFMAAWLNLFLLIGLSHTVQILLGTVAIGIGAVNVKDFFAFQQGLSFSIPKSAKPSLYAHIRRIVHAEQRTGALIGVIVLAGLVNIIELLCTAGFPALYTHVLTTYQLPVWHYYAYLGLYNLAYIADDALMVTLAVITLGRRRLEEREGRWLKLISGAVMIALGLMLVVKPSLLSR
ncbi:MAG TPA: glutaredoxin family protein [Nitrospira sp.]|nr:glutaredoxin family protein [Nitrospira sp.]HNA28073.1 glutaredoxin family protein [Nitrospira sp.]HNN43522.1 glutaredoxin family protein [Nitrospira sp.]HNO36252.1 glutaredoxin family protein [Nitrospira sp.]HUM40843.1 glutaredoxin family protein [Nitrospira sp.]